MKIFYSLIIVFLLSTSIYGQGAYLDRGQSGFDIGASFLTNKDATGIGGSVGYSVSGIFDFEIGVARYSFDQKLFGEDLSAMVISPSVTYYALKQNEDLPISFAIGAGYDWQTYSNKVLDDNNVDMTGGFFSVGGALFGYFQTSSSFRIQPSVGFSYFTGEQKVKDNNGNEETEKDDTTVFSLGLGLVFNTSLTNVFVISPRVGISEGTTSFGVALTFILGTK